MSDWIYSRSVDLEKHFLSLNPHLILTTILFYESSFKFIKARPSGRGVLMIAFETHFPYQTSHWPNDSRFTGSFQRKPDSSFIPMSPTFALLDLS